MTYTTGGKSGGVLGHDGGSEDGHGGEDGGDELHFDDLVMGREVVKKNRREDVEVGRGD